MSWHLHHLRGCSPESLAHYLKALGILKIVGVRDPEARGYWRDEAFFLVTRLTPDELEHYFLDEYQPAPFVSPWNRGSGFYGKADPALRAVEESQASRFRPYRDGIAAARVPLDAIAAADAKVRQLKDRTKVSKGMTVDEKAVARRLKEDAGYKAELAEAERGFKRLKGELFAPLNVNWRGGHRAWMDAAMVTLEDGSTVKPSLLGTGGNDGNLDFTNNVMQRLGDIFDLSSVEGVPQSGAPAWLQQALWCRPSTGLLKGAAVGQFLPGSVGGANSSTGPDGESLVNPWDFVLMMEGTLLFRGRMTRRASSERAVGASAPFAFRAVGAGVGSRGEEKSERGEQWMPLWTAPASPAEVTDLFGEGRLQLGRQMAPGPIDGVRAACRLGAARGISSFVRFGYLERNGQSTLAVPLGRVNVLNRADAEIADDVMPWAERLRRLARDKHAPARLKYAEARLADAVFAALAHDPSPSRWQAVLLAAVAIEGVQAGGSAVAAGPLPALSRRWLAATDDGTVEYRLARALGSAAQEYSRAGRPIDSVRHHWLPLEEGARRYLKVEKRLRQDPRVVATGRDPLADLVAVVERRVIEDAQRGQRHLPIVGAPGQGAQLSDLRLFLEGRVDVERLVGLARAFMAVRWEGHSSGPQRSSDGAMPDEGWLAVRLAHLAWPLNNETRIPVDPAVVRRLSSGDGGGAHIALRRLRAVGMAVPVSGVCIDSATARRWAAALVFPISVTKASAIADAMTRI